MDEFTIHMSVTTLAPCPGMSPLFFILDLSSPLTHYPNDGSSLASFQNKSQKFNQFAYCGPFYYLVSIVYITIYR